MNKQLGTKLGNLSYPNLALSLLKKKSIWNLTSGYLNLVEVFFKLIFESIIGETLFGDRGMSVKIEHDSSLCNSTSENFKNIPSNNLKSSRYLGTRFRYFIHSLRFVTSSVLTCFFSYPFEILKLRTMQYIGNKPYTGVFDTGKRVVEEEGFKGLYKGFPEYLLYSFVQSISRILTLPLTGLLVKFVICLPGLNYFQPDLFLTLNQLTASIISYPFETIYRRISGQCKWVDLECTPELEKSLFNDTLHQCYNLSSWDLWSGYPVYIFSSVLQSATLILARKMLINFFLWNNGYTRRIFDSSPLPCSNKILPSEEVKRRMKYIRVISETRNQDI